MKVELLIVTFRRDFEYLKWCLRSIRKFTTGFAGVTLVVPTPHAEECEAISEYNPTGIHTTVKSFEETPEKGMLHHEFLICTADVLCPDADFIMHMDADCVFKCHTNLEDYFINGKPVMLMERYERFRRVAHDHGVLRWKTAVERCLGGVSDFEFMRRPGAVHPRAIYAKTRELIEKHTGKSFFDFVMSCENKYPQTFCEFNTLGEAAWRHMRDAYHWVNLEHAPWPKLTIQQFWSHGDIDKPQHIWCDHKQQWITPLIYCQELIGL